MEPWACTFLDVESFVVKNRNSPFSYSQYRTHVWWQEKREYGEKEEKEKERRKKKSEESGEKSKGKRSRNLNLEDS